MKVRVTRISEQMKYAGETRVLSELLDVHFEGEASFTADMTPHAVSVNGLAVGDWYSITFVPCEPPAKENA